MAAKSVFTQSVFYFLTTKGLKRFSFCFFSSLGFIWTLLELTSFLSTKVKCLFEGNLVALAAIIILSALAGIYWAFPPVKVSHDFPVSDTRITIQLGDILQEENPIVIPTSDYFDVFFSKSGISLKSQMVAKIYENNYQYVNKLISDSLSKQNIKGEENTSKRQGKQIKFEMGTTAILPAHKFGEVFLTVFTMVSEREADKITETTAALYNQALMKLWDKYRNYGKQRNLSIPVFGSGLTASGFSMILLIQMICISFALYSKKGKITNNLKIIIPEDKYDPMLFSSLNLFLKTLEI